MASYGEPALPRRAPTSSSTHDGDGGFATEPVDWDAFAPPARRGRRRLDAPPRRPRRASVQRAPGGGRCSSSPRWLHERTGERALTMAGGVALNCVANMRLCASGPVRRRLGAAGGRRHRHRARRGAARRPRARRPRRADADRGARAGWSDDELAGWLDAPAVASRAPRRPGRRGRRGARRRRHRRLVPGPQRVRPARARPPLACSPTRGARDDLERLNDVKGREQFRPVAPMVLADRAAEIFDGPLPEPVHALHPRRRPTLARPHPRRRPRRRHRPHPDGRPRGRAAHGGGCSSASRRAPGCPSSSTRRLNTAGRPMVDDPRDALECFGSAPVDLLAIGPVRRPPRPASAARWAARGGAARVTGRRRRSSSRRSAARRSARLLARARVPARLAARRVIVRRRPAATGRRRSTVRHGAAGTGRVLVDGRRRGPAAARNAGWRASPRAVDRVPRRRRRARARRGCAALPRTSPPLARRRRRPPGPDRASRCRPTGGPPTGSATSPGSQDARWATADMAVPARRARRGRRLRRALPARLPRGRRPRRCASSRRGWRIVRGHARACSIPSARRAAGRQRAQQAGNADDVLMRALHGPRLAASAPARRAVACRAAPARRRARRRCGARRARPPASPPRGRRWPPRPGRRGPPPWPGARIAPGPADRRTRSPRWWRPRAALPLAATAWWLAGMRRRGAGGPGADRPRRDAVLLDRDGTLVVDVPYNGDPARVRADARRAGGARPAARARACRIGRRHQPERHRAAAC